MNAPPAPAVPVAPLLAVPAPASLSAGPPLRGLSPAELAVLQGAAVRFLDCHPAPPATRDTVTAALAALAEPASSGAAGLSPGRADSYHKVAGHHWMITSRADD